MVESKPSSPLKELHSAPQTASRLRKAAVEFLDALSPPQRARATFGFADDERSIWYYTPVERRGLPLGDMEEEQRHRAYTLMASALGQTGVNQARAIIEHEPILAELERAAGTAQHNRDPGLYFFSLFGDPSGSVPWGCRIEGHHLSLHFTVVDGDLLAVTPSFFGVNPARVPHGPKKGLRILAAIEDVARELVRSLNHRQRGKAQISDTAPNDILTTNSKRAALERVEGLPATSMSKAQRQTLMRLVREYVERKSPEVAQREIRQLETRGLDGLYFVWAGGLEVGQSHYYRIQGAAFLIEYDKVQNDANHIHSVWRDQQKDFGEDLLRLHYRHHHSS